MTHESEIREVIEVAIETEALGSAFYEKMERFFDEEEEIRDLFSTLAKDERSHEKVFRLLLAETPGITNPRTTAESLSFLKAMALPETFLKDDGAIERLANIQTREDALYRALRLEKDTFGYYEAMRDLFGEHKALNKIIKEEKRHITKLMEYLITGAKMRGLGDKYAGEYRG